MFLFLLCCFSCPALPQDSPQKGNEDKEFIEYYKSKNAVPEPEESDAEFRRSLLEDDLIPRQALATTNTPQKTETQKSSETRNDFYYTQGEEKGDSHDVHTSVENKVSHTGTNMLLMGGRPLYQGTQPASNLLSNTITNMNVTIIRPQSNTSQ